MRLNSPCKINSFREAEKVEPPLGRPHLQSVRGTDRRDQPESAAGRCAPNRESDAPAPVTSP